MVRDGIEDLICRIIENLDCAFICRIAGSLLLQHLDHHVIRRFIDKGNHDILPVDRVFAAVIFGCGSLRYLPDEVPGQGIGHFVTQFFDKSLIDIDRFR